MLALIIIGILVAVLIASFFLGRSGSFNPKGTPTQEKTQAEKKYSSAANAYLPASVWSDFIPNLSGEIAGSGSCLNYTQTSNTYSIGVPCINGGSGCLNTSGPGSYYISNQTCTDPDQILAQAGTHICQTLNNGSAGTGCIASSKLEYNSITYYPGDLVPKGSIEGIIGSGSSPYFIPCGNTPCQGTIGLIIPNFSPVESITELSSNINNCITFDLSGEDNSAKNPARYDVKLEICDLQNLSQIFRLVRYSLNSDYSFTQDDNGIYAAYIFRSNGFYLAPELTFVPTLDENGVQNGVTYFFDSPISPDIKDCDSGPTGPIVNKQGIKLLLIDPNDDTVRNGIYWLLQNQTPNPILYQGSNNPQNFLGCMDGLDVSSVYQTVSYPVGQDRCANQILGIPSWFQPDVTDFTAGPTDGYFYQNKDAYLPISPQQMIYIPNIYLVPKDNTNLQEYWTYLTNQYSLQIANIPVPITSTSCSSSTAVPVLMPFLQTMQANIYSGKDTTLTNYRICGISEASYLDTSNNPSGKPILPKDNQFVSVVSYVPQMLTRISSLINISFSGGDNGTDGVASASNCNSYFNPKSYNGAYNPFNPLPT
jgi:hypothetical protein